MRRISRFFDMKKIRNRFILIQFVVIIPLVLCLGFVIYGQTKQLLIRNSSESYYKVLAGSDRILQQYLDTHIDIARTILADSALQQELRGGRGQKTSSANDIEVRTVRLRQKLEKYISGFSGMHSLYLFDTDGSGYSISNQQNSGIVPYEEICTEQWFQEAQGLEGKELFVGYNVLNESDQEISCVKLLRSLDTLETIGMMILTFDKEDMQEVFLAHQEEKGLYVIAERDGSRPIVLCGNEGILEGRSFSETIQGKETQICVTSYQSKCSDWDLLYLIRRDDMVYEAEHIKSIVFLALFVGMAVLLCMIILVCSRIMRPLELLRDDIIRVGEGERSLQNEFPDDEIGRIGKEFQKMVNEKLALREKVTLTELKNKEAELELLQSNINPHFLYNTLDSLYWMAILHDAEEIAELTKALSDVFRIALNKGKKMITIREELHFIEQYLYIQNIRFEGKIQTSVEVDEMLLDQPVIKLLLQPFVENAVYHGLEPKLEEGKIWIRIYEQDDFLCFEIEDNGVGMDVETALSGGYALRNSMERIRLVYGETASVTFESKPGEGVKVKICVPKGVEGC